MSIEPKSLSLLDEIKSWKLGNTSLDSINLAISMKLNNRVFAYLYPKHHYYLIQTYDLGNKWKDFR